MSEENYKHTHSIGHNGKKYTWIVKNLWLASDQLEPFDYQISDFKSFDEEFWFGDRFKPTIRKVLEHQKKIHDASYDHPIIIDEDGRVMDDIHRICKAYLEGRKTIKAVKFTKDPVPDSIEDLPVTFLKPSEYQKGANKIFNKIKCLLESVLTNAKIEHIGSSSLKGAISKGDLDIFVGLNEDNYAAALLKIEELGFVIKQDTHRDESLTMLESSDYDIDVAIQLVRIGSEYENFLDFRDILNSSDNLISEYNQLKLESEGLLPKQYREKKSKFITKVLLNSKRK